LQAEFFAHFFQKSVTRPSWLEKKPPQRLQLRQAYFIHRTEAFLITLA
jgi:hypothetical protein